MAPCTNSWMRGSGSSTSASGCATRPFNSCLYPCHRHLHAHIDLVPVPLEHAYSVMRMPLHMLYTHTQARRKTLDAMRKPTSSSSKESDAHTGASQANELANARHGIGFAFGGVEPGVMLARGQIIKQHTVSRRTCVHTPTLGQCCMHLTRHSCAACDVPCACCAIML